ncbi:hypothetical protein [Campylobacter californiensis]
MAKFKRAFMQDITQAIVISSDGSFMTKRALKAVSRHIIFG